ncbi:MAG: CDP-alcohol phosphatidyltransferase family protein [Flavobacteriales bacterium]|nr:CDP-alcohol phosphatidyltransferase family protein [Flavobacteriales bacterium]
MANESKAQLIIYNILNPLIKLFVKLGITPNMITTFGLLLNIVAAVIFILGAEQDDRSDMTYVGLGGVTILVAGLFDMMDGRLARIGNMQSSFGAFYDSVIDRYSELVMFLGICYYLISQDYFLSSLFAFVALIGSMMVSYTRSRAEGIGVDCSVGMMQRPARVVTIGASAMFCGIAYYLAGPFCFKTPESQIPLFETISIFTLPVTVVAILSNLTAFKRLNHVRKELEKREHA